MKKISIFLLVTSSLFSANAQRLVKPSNNKALTGKVKVIQDNIGLGSASNSILNKKTRAGNTLPSLLGTKQIGGNSTYDLQTNGSMPRRIIQNGTQISCGWTFSTEVPNDANAPFADRGTGYANYNGTTWSPAPTTRLEPSTRTGFGGIALDGNGDEVYIPHNGTANNLILNRKTAGVWSTNPLTTSTTSLAIWPHFATAGNWMYIVASPADSNTHTNGIRGGYFFSRSNDNGATWIDNMIPMPLVDSVGHYRGGGNSYSISAIGSHVAVVFGDMGTDLTLLTSHDYGVTWTKKVIWDWPIDNYNFAGTDITDYDHDAIVDTLWTNDGSQSAVIGANGDVHVAFPLVRVYKSGTAGYGFFYSSMLGYYNSIADSVVTLDNIFSVVHDCDKNGKFGLGSNYVGSATTDPDAMYNTIGTITMPSITIAPGTPNKILVAYTAIMDNDTTVADGAHPFWLGSSSLEGQNYRDVFVVMSQDNGTTFGYPVNISKSSHFEEAFVSTPERVTGTTFPVMYQADIEPGTLMQNNDIFDPEVENLFVVQQVNFSDLITLSADTNSACTQQEMPVGIKNVVSQNAGVISAFPNPANDIVNLSIRLVNTSKTATINIVDFTGNIIYTQSLTNVLDNNIAIPVNNFAAGVYLIKLETTSGTMVRKFVKE